MSTTTDLVVIETLKPAEVFAPGGVEKLLTKVTSDVRAITVDASTDEGRSAIKSLAYKISRSKTALDDMGKDFVAELKRASGVVDADRRIIRDRLDALRDEVRQPVDDWEAAEETRVNGHVGALDALKALEQLGPELTFAEIDDRIAALAVFAARDWQEFKERADQLLVRIGPALTTAREAMVKREAEQAELERLRKAEADRLEASRIEREAKEQKERDERIAETARLEAEARATREAEETAARAAADRARVEQERLDAIARAEKAEADAKTVVAAAEAQAEINRKNAETRAEREREAAVEAERKRVADAEAAEAEATRKREADKQHRAKINNAAVADLMANAALTEAQAKAVVIAIASKSVAGIVIHY